MKKTFIHLVEDDVALRGMLVRLLQSAGHEVRQYCSGSDLLAMIRPDDRGCALLDINVTEPGGLTVQRALLEKGIRHPAVPMTGAGDLSLLALKAETAGIMQKPFGRGAPLPVPQGIGNEVANA